MTPFAKKLMQELKDTCKFPDDVWLVESKLNDETVKARDGYGTYIVYEPGEIITVGMLPRQITRIHIFCTTQSKKEVNGSVIESNNIEDMDLLMRSLLWKYNKTVSRNGQNNTGEISKSIFVYSFPEVLCFDEVPSAIMPLEPVVETYYSDNNTYVSQDRAWNLNKFEYAPMPDFEYSRLVMMSPEFKTRHGTIIPLSEINNIQTYYKVVGEDAERKGFVDINKGINLTCRFSSTIGHQADLQYIRFAFFYAGRYYSLVWKRVSSPLPVVDYKTIQK